MPNIEQLKENFNFIYDMVTIGHIKSAFTIKHGAGIAEAIAKILIGNKIGANIKTGYELFNLELGSIIVESDRSLFIESSTLITKNDNRSCLS